MPITSSQCRLVRISPHLGARVLSRRYDTRDRLGGFLQLAPIQHRFKPYNLSGPPPANELIALIRECLCDCRRDQIGAIGLMGREADLGR